MRGNPLELSTRADALRRALSRVARYAALILIPLGVPVAHAQQDEDALEAVSIEDLKCVYLSCSREASDGGLTGMGIMQCSIVYETLKRRAFGGDFDRLLAWSKAQPAGCAAAGRVSVEVQVSPNGRVHRPEPGR